MSDTSHKTNQELLDELMRTAMSGVLLSGPDGTLTNVLAQKPELRKLREDVLNRMSPCWVKSAD